MNLRKSFIFVVMFFMLLSNVSLANGLPEREAQPNNKKNNSTIKETSEEQYEDNDIVRVIVELESAPAIEYAQEAGLSYSELTSEKKGSLKNSLLKEQQAVKSQLKSKNISVEYKNNFTTVFNGFSGETEFGNLTEVKSLPQVKEVHISHEYERPEEQPDMVYSKELVEAQKTWQNYGYDGEGMVVGIIDTGVDPSHKDMILSADTTPEITELAVNKFVGQAHIEGKYFTEKVPFGYNYADQNNEILDLGPGASHHGMHVAGTVAANGDEENGGIKGVAPEAQLLALKVFGNDPEMPSTWSDIYVKAIDDSIELGADVLNMSLGSTAAFVRSEDPEQQAIARAVENGVLMAISAGNSAHLGNGWSNPYASNPDVGVVGSPGLSTDSLQVASLENQKIQVDGFQVKLDGEVYKTIGYKKQDTPLMLDLFKNKEMEVVYVGDGQPDKYEDKDVEGKIVFVVRTGGFFYAQIEAAAEAAGAAGVIVRGAEGHGDYVSMALDSPTIPMVSLSISDGNDLLEKVTTEGKDFSVIFDGSMIAANNPAAGTLSAFTSWGVTPNLDFKPEITAPGGQIYSTLQNDQYGIMSGTSMAAPHVAGGSALVTQRVEKDFAGVTGFDKVQLSKNILMNTAAPVIDKGLVNDYFGWDLPYSPRRQGAGVMQLHAAMSTPVVVTETGSSEGKVALREIGNITTFNLSAENFSSEAVNYDLTANVQTDFAAESLLGYAADGLEAQKIIDSTVKFTVNGEEVTSVNIPANGSVDFQVEVDVTNAKVLADDLVTPVAIDEVFENGYFVEGFVSLTSNELVSTMNTNATEANSVSEGIYIGGEVNKYYSLLEFMNSSNKAEELNAAGLENVKLYQEGKIASASDILVDGGWIAAQEDYQVGDLAGTYTKVDGTTYQPEQPEFVEKEIHPELTVPFVGFKGDWGAAPIVDGSVYEGADSFYGATGLVARDGVAENGSQNYSYLGYNPANGNFSEDVIAISPNGDDVQEEAIPIVSFLRNASLVEYNVLDENGEFLRKLRSEYDVRKHYYDGGAASNYSLSPVREWDGTIKGELVEDGTYYYEIKSTLDFTGKEAQSKKFKVVVDTVAPTVSATFENETLNIDYQDQGIGSGYIDVLVNGESVLEAPLSSETDEYKMSGISPYGAIVEVVAYDFAGNTSSYTIEGAGDTTIPAIIATTPDALGVYGTSEVEVAGYVTDGSEITSFTIDGEEVTLTEGEDGKWLFSKTLTLQDGVHKISIAGEDQKGNKIEFKRTIFVDTTAAEITVNSALEVASDATTYELDLTLSDNFEEVRLFIDGSEEYYNALAEPYVMEGFTHNFTKTVELEEGTNTFVVEVEDLAGHVTTKTVTVTRAAE
ncbi:S8 family serine peptidase [Rossellomorea vietnamensis]|uniref:S8 family serine peptidase n=1 Tax=Rossellomorea vietnamensis TaxID=218284 RepID=A0A5D4KFF3_9BACI|nr:S8 family serine peptidase [Rossellomorea vietnamensis]TYR76017.1 S8 family serine peptidase [Rossellomorea vietnamensis]